MRDSHIVDTSLSTEPLIGSWMWAIEDTRARTMEILDGLTQVALDWLPPDGESTISTVLYHIALIEVDWLYMEVLVQPYPPDVVALFPYEDRDAQGRLLQIQGETLANHLSRLSTVRQRLLSVFQQMDITEFRRVRELPSYDVTPEWVLHHLMQHEAEHRSQIQALRTRATAPMVSGGFEQHP